MPQDANEIYELGPFRISAGERVLRREDRIVPLTPKCFDTLLVLAQHAGNVVEKQMLMREVWPDSFVEESNLSQNIFVLRKTLGETPEGAKYIETIPKRGYRLVVPGGGARPRRQPAAGRRFTPGLSARGETKDLPVYRSRDRHWLYPDRCPRGLAVRRRLLVRRP